MAIDIPRFLTATQADLIRETEPARMDALDEDALIDLHTRIRRARNKYVKLYRRTGAARVPDVGARGHSRPGNLKNSEKAEVFELALARVSARLDVVARAAAEELKQERLALAAAVKSGSGPDGLGVVGTSPVSPAGERTKASSVRPAGGDRAAAAVAAKGARNQAKRDGR